MGIIICHITPVKRSTTIRINPTGSILLRGIPIAGGNKLTAIRPPSVGGIGIRLKTINRTLINIPIAAILTRIIIKLDGLPISLVAIKVISTQKTAMARLAAGPAMATRAVSRFGLPRLRQSIGTGFAQPKTKPTVRYNTAGTIIVPTGSICLMGFKLNRPSIIAVRSPSLYATQPCATSCRTIAKMTGISEIRKKSIVLRFEFIRAS